MTIKTRLEVLNHELNEAHNILVEMFVERDILLLEKVDPFHKEVVEYNKQITAMQKRIEFIEQLLESESTHDFKCSIHIGRNKDGFN